MKLNPNFIAIFAFLVIGLIWSGGHVGWLIALGVFVFLGVVATGSDSVAKERAARARRHRMY